MEDRCAGEGGGTHQPGQIGARAAELVIGQLRTRRRAARADLKRLVEVLGGSVRDDEAAEQRESEEPTVSFLRRRPTDAKGER